MLIKTKDPADTAVQELETIARLPSLPGETLAKVNTELKTLKAGNRGELDSAYFIDFHYRDKPNWAVIHDLRIEYGGKVAQIDHLLVTRFLEFYVLESKRYTYGLKITDRGEFMFWDGHRYVPMESPIEQTKRHAAVLEQLLKGEGLLPKRLGVVLSPTFKPFVLVSPKSSVIRQDRKLFDSDMVIKSDELFRQITADFDKASTPSMMGSLAKIVSRETLTHLAQRLVSYHRPAAINYYARFGVSPLQTAPPRTAVPESKNTGNELQPHSRYFCFRCNRPVTQRVATFCFQHKERFGGKAYCFDCQKVF
jgi:Nuclease-related domain